ncbi:MAG TPA: hypothetical protein VKA15_05820, partial [Isosphaeraceae bacterium]|nr:hypothetical protein [Isosphaeraceae bacterium]
QERSDPSRQQQMRDRYGDTFARVQDSCAVIDSLSSPFNGSLEACLFRAGSPGGNSLYLSLKSRPSCCICLLASVPPPNADDPQNDLYFTLLRAGVPAALWLREPPPADDLSDELSKFVRNRLFGEFPRDVLQERQLAEQAGVPWHRGRHLTLLWDDPRRPTSPDTDPDNRYRSAR